MTKTKYFDWISGEEVNAEEEKDSKTSFVEDFKKILKDVSAEHDWRLTLLRSLAQSVKNEDLDLTELVDMGFLLKECEALLDEMRKDFKAHKEMIGKVSCYQLSLEDEPKHRGTLATGSSKITHYSSIPHPEKEPERFIEVCKFFGIDVGDSPTGMVRFHWPTVKDKITQAMENGEELPEGLSDVKTDLGMTYRRLVSKGD
jgi:hypothetical protein